MTIQELLVYASTSGASDLFITSGKAPSFRMSGELTVSEEQPAAAADIDGFRAARNLHLISELRANRSFHRALLLRLAHVQHGAPHARSR